MKLIDFVWYVINNARGKIGWVDMKDVQRWIKMSNKK
jgi:hypothetical protein